ncbi:glycosyltransferase family 39 protein [Patescibacteria group bacterium]|nr:glycosyltransferase family 39 protein [Patescibacteria group bacterium]
MKKMFTNWKVLLTVIIIIAAFLRFYALDKIPASLNPDEASLGYTSFSLLKTGADEHGKFLPLSLQSFGDWKLPVYSYIGVVPIALFGLSEFSVRLTSAIAGVVGVLLIYFIGLKLFYKKGIALISALLFTLSPWSIYFSRGAYEVNLATTIFLAGLLSFIVYVYQNKKNTKLFVISLLFFSLTMFTHHNYIVFSPLFVFALMILFRKKIHMDKTGFAVICVFLFLILVSYFSMANGGSNKVSSLVIFNDKNILYGRVEKLRGDNASKNQLFERILYTKYLGISYQIAQNYLNSFSPSFLFDKGGEKLVHNLGDFGNFYLFDAFLIAVGIAGLFWNREKSLAILLAWIFIAPIPSAVTRDTPNSTRLFTLMPAFILIASYGAYQISVILKKKTIVSYLAKGILVSLFSLNVLYFLDIYYVHLNFQRVRFWHYGYREAVRLTQDYKTYNVVMRGPDNFPYIYFLFYNQYDPIKFRKEVKYYPPTNEGFYFIKSFGRYIFPWLIDYSKLEGKTVYVDDTKVNYRKNKIYLPSGEPILGYEVKN